MDGYNAVAEGLNQFKQIWMKAGITIPFYGLWNPAVIICIAGMLKYQLIQGLEAWLDLNYCSRTVIAPLFMGWAIFASQRLNRFHSFKITEAAKIPRSYNQACLLYQRLHPCLYLQLE